MSIVWKIVIFALEYILKRDKLELVVVKIEFYITLAYSK